MANLIHDSSTQYTYDKANRVASITAASVTTTYTYNGDGDRIAQTVGTVTTTYVLDTATPLTMVLSETTGPSTTRYWPVSTGRSGAACYWVGVVGAATRQ